MTVKLLPAFLLASLAWPAPAQETEPGRQTTTIRTEGESIVSAKPDRVQIDIGVLTQAPTAEAATGENATRSEAVLQALRRETDPSAVIKTVSYSLTPVFRYPKEGSPSITGYSATNVVQVTTDDVARAGRIIDAALQAGANKIERLRFTLRDEQAAELAALRAAAAKARAKAEALAAALDLKILRIRQVEEEAGYRRPEERAFAMAEGMSRGGQTAVEPGAIEVRAHVTLLLEAAPK